MGQLPRAADAVPIERGFIQYDNEAARQHPGDDHPVERVAEGVQTSTGARCVVQGYRQFIESLPGYRSSKIQRQIVRLRQSAHPVFRGDFPSYGGAYRFLVGRIEDGLAHRL